MVDRWVAVKKVVKSLYLKGIDHFYSLLIEVSVESICNEKRCTGHLSCFSYLLGQEE